MQIVDLLSKNKSDIDQLPCSVICDGIQGVGQIRSYTEPTDRTWSNFPSEQLSRIINFIRDLPARSDVWQAWREKRNDC